MTCLNLPKECWVAVLSSDKANFQRKVIIKDKEDTAS
jgi:hypothetical protein